ncbi:MAG TPA: succinate dehydrogenase, cytochrome b556 subunit [Ardenticatenaceae bacterium]|jgi:succinate dehydrogenase / fumarate reductase cytochrome b subunit
MVSSAYDTLIQGLQYRGREGQWSWILHRLTGLGVFLFLALHIFDIYLIMLGPEPFNTLSTIYHHPIARVGHIFLFFSLLWHAFNGFRITLLDFVPRLWKYQRQTVWIQVVVFLATFIPSTIAIMLAIMQGAE